MSFRRLTPDTRPQSFQDDVGRYLEKDIWHEEDGQGGIELIALELEILLQTKDGGIADVGSAHASRFGE